MYLKYIFHHNINLTIQCEPFFCCTLPYHHKRLMTYVPEQCNDEKLKKVLKVNDFRHFFLDFIIVTYYN